MIFNKLLSAIVITTMITGSSFKLNNYRTNTTVVIKEVKQEEIKSDTSAREKILIETGINVPKKMPREHVKIMYDEAKKRNVPIKIMVKVVQKESKFNAKAINKNSGAIGYMQLMPTTYSLYRKKLNLLKNPESNIKIGAYYLQEMYKIWDKAHYSEDKKWRLALASYNAGIDKVIKIKKVPNIKETKKFVEFVLE